MFAYIDLGSVRLHDPANGQPRSAKRVSGLTGIPGVRGDVWDRPEADGAVEADDQFMTPRLVVVDAETWAGGTIPAVWADWRLLAKQFELAMRDPVLIKWRESGGTIDLQGYCRLAGPVIPVQDESENGPLVVYQAQLRLADPRWYSQTETASVIGAPVTSGGMPIPFVFPIPFGSGSSGGLVVVTNNGNTRTWPRIVIAGSITNPVVENLTQGRRLYFDNLVVAAGQTLTIDTNPSNPRSATVDGASVMGTLRFADSDFFGIEPGATESINFYGAGGGYSAGTQMTVYVRDAYNA